MNTFKVKIKRVSVYRFEGKDYHPGDTLEIPSSKFESGFMEKVVPEKTKEKPKVAAGDKTGSVTVKPDEPKKTTDEKKPKN